VFEGRLVSLGAARLRIVGLDSGDQPIVSENGDTVIVFDGQIYNRAELRDELERCGHRFRTRTDAEIVLAAFREWKTAAFARLRGMFAVALWSEPERRLVLARDRMGIKPLYIACHHDDLLFGSELKAIFAHPEFPRRLDLHGLDCYLSLNYVPCPRTLCEGIRKLPPGRWLEWFDGVTRGEPYWRLPDCEEPYWTLDSATLALDALLKKSVREHLQADVPVGIWLGGGIDSATILHYAASASATRLKTFSTACCRRSADEPAAIRRLAADYGTDHQEFDWKARLDLEEIPYFCDDPTADANALPFWLLAQQTKPAASVAISGAGADELFGGRQTYRADDLARPWRRCPSGLLRLAAGAARLCSAFDLETGCKLQRFLTGCGMTPGRAHVYWNGTFSEAEKLTLLNAFLPPALQELLRELESGGDREAVYLRFDQQYPLADDVLLVAGRVGMAHALQVRPPFLDHRLVELAAALPAAFKIDGARQKVILRRLMRGKLPEAVLRRKREGFDIPVHDWMRGPLRPLLEDTLADGPVLCPGIFRQEAVADCARRHAERRANLGYHLWGLMILFLWMKRWRIQAEPDSQRALAPAAKTITSI